MALPTLAQAQATTTTTTTTTTDQTTSTTTPATPTPAQVNTGTETGTEAVTKLPPFEVQSSSKDIGYYTQNTTMGTRLNSNLGDLAASITVISKQQMTDTSSVNINDLFLYEASTEGTENYTSVGGAAKGTGFADTIQNSPQTANRVRGLGSVDITRDYFITNPAIQLDSYNIDDAELSRGPNSTLFGIGSPSGILNESIEKAVLNKDSNEVSARFGSFGDFRTSVNINRALIPDKLAIAVAGLYANAHPTAEEPSYDIQRREFAAITIKPYADTTVRANVEYYDNPNRRAESLTPSDEVTPWLKGGSPKWDPITYTATVNGVTSAPITNNLLVPEGLIGTGLGNNGSGSPQFYIVHGVAQLWEEAELGTNFASPGTPTSGGGLVGPIGNERLQYSGGDYTKFASSAPAGQVTYPLFKDSGITNPKLLNYQGVNMLSGNLGEDKAVTYNVEIEQTILSDVQAAGAMNNLFLEAGWYREQFTTLQNNYMGGNVGNAIQIDPNSRFLNGTPNPYFGVPFMVLQQPDEVPAQQLNEQERLQLVYQFDFTRNTNWTKWLGHHTLDAFYQHRENDTNTWRYRLEVLDSHSWNSTTDIGPNSNGPSGSIAERFYLSNSGSAVSYDPGEFVNTNFTYPLTWYNTQLNGGTWTNENTKFGPTVFNASRAQQQVWSYAGSLQDYLIDDRLVLTLGQRHDYERSRGTSINLNGDPTTGLNDLDNLSQFSNWVYADGITRQAGAVLHITKWLSAHYNQSANFQVASLGEDLFGNVLPNPSGTGKDYGVAVSLLDDKLVAELNWYKSNAANSREGGTTYVNRAVRIDYGQFVPWAQEIATNNLGVNASGPAINVYAQNIVHYPNGLSALYTATQYEADTQTIQARGVEFNLIYNPTRNWTMKVTADQDQAIYSNVYPHVQAYLAARLPIWTAATDPVYGPFWTTISAGNAGPASAALGNASPQQWLAGTVDASGLDVELAQQGIVSPDLSKYHFNYLTNYQFVAGRLAGFGLGTALRYETPSAIGYPGGAPDPGALGAIDTLQAFKPIYGKEVLHQDAWISYKMKLPFLDNRIRMTMQLNCRDVWSKGYLLTVQVNPDGSGETYRIIPPRQWYLQTTFDF